MKTFFAMSIALLLTCLSAVAHAEAPRGGSKQPITSITPSVVTAESTLSRSAYLDMMYDFEVYSAPDVTGQTEFVIVGRDADTGDWDLVHRHQWTGSVDHGSWSDMGIWKFTTWSNARNAAENQIDDGKLTDYEIIEQNVQPQWTYEDTFAKRAQAEDFADEIEYWSDQFGVPHITKIVSINALSFSPIGTLK